MSEKYYTVQDKINGAFSTVNESDYKPYDPASGGGDDETLKGIIDKSITKCDIPQGTTNIGKGPFIDCTALTSVTIPDSVTKINDYAFQGCTALTSVTIGNGVTSIGKGPFSDCSNLATITIKATTPPKIDNPYVIPDNVTAIYVPSVSVNTYKSANGWYRHSSKIQAIQG
jgi:hypothetical protein